MTGNLARGPEARSRRAAIRRRIADGAIDVPALLEGAGDEAVEGEALSMAVAVLIAAVPGMGPAAVDRVLGGRCGPSRRLGELTTRARRGIADSVRKELA